MLNLSAIFSLMSLVFVPIATGYSAYMGGAKFWSLLFAVFGLLAALAMAYTIFKVESAKFQSRSSFLDISRLLSPGAIFFAGLFLATSIANYLVSINFGK